MADIPWLAVGSFASSVGLVYLLVQLRTHWDKPGAKWFVLTLGTQTVWAVAYGLGLLVFGPTVRLGLEQVTWVGMLWVGFLYLSFALGYSGRTELFGARWYRSVVAVPILGSVLVATNPLHGLVWEGFEVVETFGSAGATYQLLPLGMGLIFISVLFVSVGTAVLFDTVISYGPLYRQETIAVGLSPVIPGLTLLVWASGIGPVPAVNLTTIAFIPHVVLDVYAFIQSDMFEFHPATRRAGERAAIDDIATPVAIIDESGRIVNLNPAAETMLGVEKREALTDPLDERCAGDQFVPGQDDDRFGFEHAGRRREYKIQQTELNDIAGTKLGYTVVFQDITDEIRRERRLEVLNRFLRHNVRNEGSVIRARAGLLAERLDGEPGDYADTIEQAVNRLVESGNKARTLSEASTAGTDFEPLSLRWLVDGVVESLSAEYDGTVTVDISGEITVYSQPVLLEVLVTNLVENALKHVPDAEVTVRATVDGDRAVVSVSDDGPGIPDHELSVLQRGQETPLDHGSGIGLWLVRWVITTLSAELDFDTSDGTTVTVRLPLHDESESPGGEPADVRTT